MAFEAANQCRQKVSARLDRHGGGGRSSVIGCYFLGSGCHHSIVPSPRPPQTKKYGVWLNTSNVVQLSTLECGLNGKFSEGWYFKWEKKLDANFV